MKLEELLHDPSLWTSLAAAFDAGRDEEWDEFNYESRIRDDIHENHELKSRVVRALEQRVLSRLSRPPEITAEELFQIAVNQLAGLAVQNAGRLSHDDLRIRHPELWLAKQRFCAFANALVFEELESDSDAFNLGQWLSTSDNSDESVNQLWSSGKYTLFGQLEKVVEEYPLPYCLPDGFDRYELMGYLVGSCSENAMNSAVGRLRPVFESAAKTARFSAVRGAKTDIERFGGFWTHSGPPLSYFVAGDGGKVFRTCVAVCFDELKSKDVLVGIREAAQCLIDADGQGETEIAMIKCFAAIESIVCFKKTQLVDQISRYVPTLLQPNGLGRGHRGEVLNDVYKLRSSNAHGPRDSVSTDECAWVRRLASGVIRAVMLWREHQIRLNVPTTAKELESDLKNASSDGKELVQVDVDMSEFLPDDVNQEFDPFDIGKLI